MTGGKEFQDGSIGCGTAYLTKPYYTKLPDRSADYCGSPVWSREELTELVKKVHNAGAQMHIHCNGDAAIDDVLYAYEQAQLEIRVRTPPCRCSCADEPHGPARKK